VGIIKLFRVDFKYGQRDLSAVSVVEKVLTLSQLEVQLEPLIEVNDNTESSESFFFCV
jgi:hypothetical protein